MHSSGGPRNGEEVRDCFLRTKTVLTPFSLTPFSREAEQESLGRHVALKVLRSGFITGSKQLSRFEREARSAAQLHHTNIVPVFGVGQQGDTHYYVMQLIQGQPLDDVVAELKWLRHQDRPATAGASNPERPPAPQHNDGREARVMALGLVSGQYPKEKDGHYPMIH